MAEQGRDTHGDGGRIIIVSSVMADYPYLIDTSAPYNSAKAGLDALVRTMSSSLAPKGVFVNGLHPGWIDTPGERQFTSAEEIAKAARFLPWGLGKPEDMAEAALFLADARYITGSILDVDGGFRVAQRIPGLHAPMPLTQ